MVFFVAMKSFHMRTENETPMIFSGWEGMGMLLFVAFPCNSLRLPQLFSSRLGTI